MIPRKKVKEVSVMLKAIHAREDKEVAIKKINNVIEKLKDLKLSEAAGKVEIAAYETLS